MLRLGHGSEHSTKERDVRARAHASAGRARGWRPLARAARPGLRRHSRYLRFAAVSAPPGRLRYALAYYPGATALARHRRAALATPQGALPAADSAAFPRARRAHAQKLRIHPAEDQLRARPRDRDSGAPIFAGAARAPW